MRPKPFTDKDLKLIEKLAGDGLTREEIAGVFGMGVSTLYKRQAEDGELQKALDRGKGKAIAGVADRLYQKALKGDNACMFFYLKTRAGWRETNVMEHTGKDGGSIKIEEMSDYDRKRRAVEILDTARARRALHAPNDGGKGESEAC